MNEDSFTSFIKIDSESTNIEIPSSEKETRIITITTDNQNEWKGLYFHPDFLPEFLGWVSPLLRHQFNKYLKYS
jgi:hypothetical protein